MLSWPGSAPHPLRFIDRCFRSNLAGVAPGWMWSEFQYRHVLLPAKFETDLVLAGGRRELPRHDTVWRRLQSLCTSIQEVGESLGCGDGDTTESEEDGLQTHPVPVGVDDLLQVYGSQEEVDRVCTPRQPGDLQLEHPIHVHRAPPPPPPGSKTYRRTIFVSWDHGKVINASLTTVFADTWKSLWENNNLLEVEPERVLKRQKR